MDKAVIFGIYDFVSFHIGRALLNEGVEVIGIHTDEAGEAPFVEEKRLEVGRNANFKEIALSELDTYREADTIKTTFIFSLYDLYMSNTETILHKQTVTSLQQFIESNKNLTNILFILPIQLLSSKESQALQTVIKQASAWGKKNFYYYLPSIYGPWQPSTFIFQQALIGKMEKQDIKESKREWTGDVLFVEDAIKVILSSSEYSDTEDEMKFLIESGLEDYWNNCAAQLKLNNVMTERIQSELFEENKTINRVTVNRVTPFSDSIEKQLEIVKRFN
ncbi:hypothetical protein V7266_13955 [Neobacillus drentensis]|uniref:hypothetical protein n=1 Tax=Neobacillus drentensis TaxID=220684 RepID=UPI002FFF80B3